MVKVEADLNYQRLYVIADQALSAEDMQFLSDNICREAKKLLPGWVAALDLRGMWVQDPFFCDRVKLLQQSLISSGARKIGTLLDNSSIQMYLGQAGLKTHSNEITQRFFNEKNWEQFLAQQ
jgi:hypothetical protein